MPEAAVHLASGKVRELYALDDERLLLVASDRISTFDVILPTRDPRQGARPDRPVGVLVRADARDRPEPPAGAARRRPLARVPAARDAAGRGRRARLPVRLGLEGLPGDRVGLRARAPRRARRVGPAAGADRHPGDEGRRPATTRTSTRGPRPSSSAPSAGPRSRRSRSRSTRSRPAHAEARGIILADTKFELGLDRRRDARTLGDEALTPDSSRFWPADEYAPGGPQPSFDKQYVRDYCESLGWDRTDPGPEVPADVVAGTRARYVEAFERLTGLAFDAVHRRPAGGAAVKVTVLVRPKQGILDPQGEAVQGSLRKLGFAVGGARVGRLVDLEVDDRRAAGGAGPGRAHVPASCWRTR